MAKKSKPIPVGAPDATVVAVTVTAHDNSWTGQIRYPNSTPRRGSPALTRLFNACARKFDWYQAVESGRLTNLLLWHANDQLDKLAKAGDKAGVAALADALAKEFGGTLNPVWQAKNAPPKAGGKPTQKPAPSALPPSIARAVKVAAGK